MEYKKGTNERRYKIFFKFKFKIFLGLTKLLSLMPYDVISYYTWNQVIPQWLQAISQEIAEDDLIELKVLLW